MLVNWCHDGTTVKMLGKPSSDADLMNQPDPGWFALNQAFGFEVGVKKGSVLQPKVANGVGGSKTVTATAEFEASFSATAIVLSAFGTEAAFKEAIQAIRLLPAAKRLPAERALAVLVCSAIIRFRATRVLMDALSSVAPKLREQLQAKIFGFIDNKVQNEKWALRFGVTVWKPRLSFDLHPDGTAIVGLGGTHGVAVVPRVAKFHNSP
jgi:hypothetical protein